MNKIDRNFWLHLFGSMVLAVFFGFWAVLFGLARELITGFVVGKLPDKWQQIMCKLTFCNTGFSWFDMWTNGFGVLLGVGLRNVMIAILCG
jgi:hypothetical protein